MKSSLTIFLSGTIGLVLNIKETKMLMFSIMKPIIWLAKYLSTYVTNIDVQNLYINFMSESVYFLPPLGPLPTFLSGGLDLNTPFPTEIELPAFIPAVLIGIGASTAIGAFSRWANQYWLEVMSGDNGPQKVPRQVDLMGFAVSPTPQGDDMDSTIVVDQLDKMGCNLFTIFCERMRGFNNCLLACHIVQHGAQTTQSDSPYMCLFVRNEARVRQIGPWNIVLPPTNYVHERLFKGDGSSELVLGIWLPISYTGECLFRDPDFNIKCGGFLPKFSTYGDSVTSEMTTLFVPVRNRMTTVTFPMQTLYQRYLNIKPQVSIP